MTHPSPSILPLDIDDYIIYLDPIRNEAVSLLWYCTQDTYVDRVLQVQELLSAASYHPENFYGSVPAGNLDEMFRALTTVMMHTHNVPGERWRYDVAMVVKLLCELDDESTNDSVAMTVTICASALAMIAEKA